MPPNPRRGRRTMGAVKARPRKQRGKPSKSVDRKIGSKQAIEEIKASIAIRDSLLSEAEEVTTNATLQRALIANEFVERCLKPARPPYEAQYLPEADAVPERKRCEAVKRRIAQLRAQIAAG
jgi:hypothetical protein